jgi:hypothetical protein
MKDLLIEMLGARGKTSAEIARKLRVSKRTSFGHEPGIVDVKIDGCSGGSADVLIR